MSEDLQPENGTELTESAEPTETVDLAQALAALEAKLDGKLAQVGKDFGRLRSKLKAQPQDQEPVAAEPVGFSRAEIKAAAKLERMRDQLPDTVLARIDAMEADGRSFAELADLASLALDAMGATPKLTNNPARPSDNAATAAPRDAIRHPKTKQEYMQLIRKSRDGDKQSQAMDAKLMADPTFNPMMLK